MNNKNVLGGRSAKWVAGIGAMLATGAAMAQTSGGSTDFSTAVVAQLSDGQTQVAAIGVAVLAIVAIIALVRFVKRAI